MVWLGNCYKCMISERYWLCFWLFIEELNKKTETLAVENFLTFLKLKFSIFIIEQIINTINCELINSHSI